MRASPPATTYPPPSTLNTYIPSIPRGTVFSPATLTPPTLASATPLGDLSLRKSATLSFACCSVSRCAKADNVINTNDIINAFLFMILTYYIYNSQFGCKDNKKDLKVTCQ